MGQKYILDTNILIYSATDSLEESVKEKISTLLKDSFCISCITKIEFLSWPNQTEDEYEKSIKFLEKAEIIYLDSKIVNTASQLRKIKKRSLGDILIAATAIESNQILATRNTKDFDWIDELKLYNPFE